MVPKAGVEPARVLPLRILSPARLPIPPLRLATILYYHKVFVMAISNSKKTCIKRELFNLHCRLKHENTF